MLRGLAISTMIFMLFISPAVMHADTVSTPNVSFSLSSSGTGGAGTPPILGQSATVNFQQFNPSLGTLTGVSVVGDGTVSYSGGDLGSCKTDSMTMTPSIGATALTGVTLTHTPPVSCVFGSSHTFSLSGTNSFNVAAPGSLSNYIGLGTVGVGFSYTVQTSGEQGDDAVSWSSIPSNDTHLVYTYNPAGPSAVPEPSNMLLLGTGALGLLGPIRRKLLHRK